MNLLIKQPLHEFAKSAPQPERENKGGNQVVMK
jgi:hypothetical protein